MRTNRAVTFLVLLLAGAGWCQNDLEVASAQPERPCTKTGSMCPTCDEVAVCIGAGDGSFIQMKQSCPAGQKCISGDCVDTDVCNQGEPECVSPGYFPHPYDCKKFFLCVPTNVPSGYVKMDLECPGGTSYNVGTQDCSGTLASPVCIDRPVPECTKPLQIGAVPHDPTVFYICIEHNNNGSYTLVPDLIRCPAGRQFDGKSSCADVIPPTDAKGKKKSKA